MLMSSKSPLLLTMGWMGIYRLAQRIQAPRVASGDGMHCAGELRDAKQICPALLCHCYAVAITATSSSPFLFPTRMRGKEFARDMHCAFNQKLWLLMKLRCERWLSKGITYRDSNSVTGRVERDSSASEELCC